jgi:hypothetical protein
MFTDYPILNEVRESKYVRPLFTDYAYDDEYLENELELDCD